MQTLVTKRESTAGKSEMYPEMRRPTVLVMPIIDRRKEAVSFSIPYKEKVITNISDLNRCGYLGGSGVNDVDEWDVKAQHAENVGDADEKEDGIFH